MRESMNMPNTADSADTTMANTRRNTSGRSFDRTHARRAVVNAIMFISLDLINPAIIFYK
jgi:hypothetical protein